MLLKEYRICMPLSVEEYRIGQLYMIAKHSHEQSENGEGVEVVRNEPCNDVTHGQGQYTEKRIHLSSRLPSWVRSMIPNIFYVTEKAWNFYPYTVTEYTCSFVPRFSIRIETAYEDNPGSTDNCLHLSEDEIALRQVDIIDIAMDSLPEHKYNKEEDPKLFHSEKTNRGPLINGWMTSTSPVMCSYKVTKVKFEVWGLQTRVEAFTHRAIRDILLLGHRQAFAWVDEWYGMSIEDIRSYEKHMAEQTRLKMNLQHGESNNDIGVNEKKSNKETT